MTQRLLHANAFLPQRLASTPRNSAITHFVARNDRVAPRLGISKSDADDDTPCSIQPWETQIPESPCLATTKTWWDRESRIELIVKITCQRDPSCQIRMEFKTKPFERTLQSATYVLALSILSLDSSSG